MDESFAGVVDETSGRHVRIFGPASVSSITLNPTF
jgi:hypothetical protein